MNIAVASGKGGTGKTTIATNLAFALAQGGRRITYVDCDVEEPNGHLFLKPTVRQRERIGTPVPAVDTAKCTGCGSCAEICQYSAIVCLNGKVMTFPELCHGCGGCARVCPADAITEIGRPIGIVERGDADGASFIHGKLDVGMVMSPPLIRAVKQWASEGSDTVIDAPPGTSCPVITAIQDAEYVLLVTEPTISGEHDLERVAELAKHFQVPALVCVNKADLNAAVTERIRRRTEETGMLFAGTVRYDKAVTQAQIAACSVVELTDAPIVEDIRKVWRTVLRRIEG